MTTDTATEATEPKMLQGDEYPAEPTTDLQSEGDTVEEPQDEQPDEASSGNREAAKFRTQRNEARAERDALAEQLAAQRRALIDWRASTFADGAVDTALLDAAGLDVDTLLDDSGCLDMPAVDAFIDSTAMRFRVQRSVQPNRQQGQPSSAPAPAGWSDVINPRTKK